MGPGTKYISHVGNLRYHSQRQRHALRIVRVEHLLRGLRPEGRELPGDEEAPETEVGRQSQ